MGPGDALKSWSITEQDKHCCEHLGGTEKKIRKDVF